MHLQKIGLLLIYLSLTQLSYAQPEKITGTIINSKDNSPIPYATIYLSAQKVGCYTNEKGGFSIQTNGLLDTMTISCIGYQTDTVVLETNVYKKIKIQLKPTQYEIETIEVSAKKQKANDFNLGFFGSKPKTNLQWFYGIGDQIAVLIQNPTDKRGIIKTINFTTLQDDQKKQTEENVNIRLKLWSFDPYTQQPGQSLLNKDVIVHIPKVKNNKDYLIDITSQYIEFPPEGLFVGIEFLGILDVDTSLQFRVGPGIPFGNVKSNSSVYLNGFKHSGWVNMQKEYQAVNEVPKIGLTLIEIE